jgi:nucleoside-diphosphate-sugar epimerase
MQNNTHLSLQEIPSIYRDKKILITGGLGFIGSNLARRLVEFGAKVTLVDSLIPEYGGNLYNVDGIEKDVTVNISDVRDIHSLRYLVKNQDFLFNLAGQTSHLDSMQNPFADLDINARAQLSIMETCKEHNPTIRVVFASTRQIYGKPDFLPVTEEHPLRPVDINGIHKMAGEWYQILYHRVYGMQTSILRLTNTYGPRMRIKDARQTFLGVWLKQILTGEKFEVWGGEQLRDFTFIDDAVNAFLLSGAKPATAGKCFNLGGDRTISLKELADLLIGLHKGGEYVIRTFPEERKKIDIGDYYSDYTLIGKEIGWKPLVSLKAGLSRTLEYYRDRLPHYL